MKLKDLVKALFGAIGDVISFLTTWIRIALDWTEEVKKVSDESISEWQRERKVDMELARKELDKRISDKLKQHEQASN